MKHMVQSHKYFHLIIGILIITFLFTACQPTPENLVVQQKDGDNLMNAIDSSDIENHNDSEQNAGEKYLAPEQWVESMTLLGGKVDAKINANLTIPDATSYPSLKIEPERFSLDDFYAFKNQFFPDCTYFSLDAPQTKEEIEQLILMTQRSISDPNSDFNTANMRTDDYQMLLQEKQSNIETWREQYKDAPSAADLSPLKVTEEQLNQGQLHMKAVSKDGILKANVYMNATSEENNRFNAIRIALYPRDPSDKSHYEYREIGDKEYLLPPLLKISADEAMQIAKYTIDSLGIEDIDYRPPLKTHHKA